MGNLSLEVRPKGRLSYHLSQSQREGHIAHPKSKADEPIADCTVKTDEPIARRTVERQMSLSLIAWSKADENAGPVP